MDKAKYIILTFLVVFTSCREPFEPESIEFLDALVVEATITNELIQQTIKLSRTYDLEATEPDFVNDATVWVEDSANNIFTFSILENGLYQSDNAFQATSIVTYRLHITVPDGKQYESTDVSLTSVSEITNLYGELGVLDTGEDVVQILVNSDNSNSEASYFRYTYEETYKLIAPFWNSFEAILTNYEEIVFPGSGNVSVFYDSEFVKRTEDEEICFVSKASVGIIQTTTNELSENLIDRFPIRNIEIDDGIIRDRYSILVKQYVQSLEAYTYYAVVNQLGINESILSQIQPGYVQGNLQSVNNSNEQVIGYFDVSSVSEKRIYFNYIDFGLLKPEYVYECLDLDFDYNDNTSGDGDLNERQEIYRLLNTFKEENFNYSIIAVPLVVESVWKITNPECGDCTTVGTNIEPDFWED